MASWAITFARNTATSPLTIDIQDNRIAGLACEKGYDPFFARVR